MHEKLSKSQVDQLGERLRHGITEADLQLLDAYRRSFSHSYENVVSRIVEQTRLSPTGRPTKSTTSICYKLARESIRLSQMQDIAGCRIVVPDLVSQDSVVATLMGLFEHGSMFDRRTKPSHGYRAVHLVIRSHDLPIEIQVRTETQHNWAELSEKLSDLVDPAAKYGGGPAWVREFLRIASAIGARLEALEPISGAGFAEKGGQVDERQEARAAELAKIKADLAALGGILLDVEKQVGG